MYDWYNNISNGDQKLPFKCIEDLKFIFAQLSNYMFRGWYTSFEKATNIHIQNDEQHRRSSFKTKRILLIIENLFKCEFEFTNDVSVGGGIGYYRCFG